MGRVIQVPPRGTLLTREYIDNLASAFSALPLSRRLCMNWGTHLLYDWIEFGGSIVTSEGTPIHVYPGILDDAHGEGSDGEWIGEQRRRPRSSRRPRKSLLCRLRLWDSIFRISGRPAGNTAQRQEAAETRDLLAAFSPVWRARYVHEVRKLRRTYAGSKAIYYGAAIKRLRIRFSEELAAWHAAQ